MCLPSEMRQPCRAFSLHAGDNELPIRRETHAVVCAFPFEIDRLALRAGEGEGHAIVAGEREARAFGSECHAFDGTVENLFVALAIVLNIDCRFARSECDAVGADGDSVDPFARDSTHFAGTASCVSGHDLAVFAAGDQRLAVYSLGGTQKAVMNHRFLEAAFKPKQRSASIGKHRHVGDEPGKNAMSRKVYWRDCRHVYALQASKAFCRAALSSLRPMKTRRLSRFSSGFHGRW